MTGTERPTVPEEIMNEILKSTVLPAKLDKISADLASAHAEEALYDALLANNGGDPDNTLSAKASERGPILP